MIESPRFVEFDRQWRQHRLHAAGKRRITRGRVLHLIEFWWKAAEIVNGPGSCRDGDAGFWNKPMSRDRPIRRHAWVYLLFSTAFMGLPWPKKIVGAGSAIRFDHTTAADLRRRLARCPAQTGSP